MKSIMDLVKETSNLSLKSDQFVNKRQNYIEWQEYFMGIALMAKERSKDPVCQVGACIVNKDKKIIGIGYNGMPTGFSDIKNDIIKEDPWTRENKHKYVCHAEMNAIMNKNTEDAKDCSIYVTHFPCNECAKLIIQSGIKEVIYLSDKKLDKPEPNKYTAALNMFEALGITYRKFLPIRRTIAINFYDE